MMSEKNPENQIPGPDEILSAYEKLFGDDEKSVSRFKRSGLRYVTFPGGITLIEQNPEKESQWAEKALKGHKIAWLMRDGEYLARVVDGEVEILDR
jgi:hypothetical protein